MAASAPPQWQVTAAIFDLDGLLLDTEPLYLQATAEVLSRYGRELERDVLRRYIGIPSEQTMQRLADFAAGVAHELNNRWLRSWATRSFFRCSARTSAVRRWRRSSRRRYERARWRATCWCSLVRSRRSDGT